MPSRLGYWKCQALAQSIRYLLEYVGEEYEDVLYNFDNAQLWFEEDKKNLEMLLPNLPYYIDDSVKLSQSNVILRYLAVKYQLSGREHGYNEYDVMMMEQHIFQGNRDLNVRVYLSDLQETMPAILQKLNATIKGIADVLGERKWIFGDHINYVDFLAFATLDIFRRFDSSLLHNYPNVISYVQRFHDLTKIEEYRKSARYIENPIYGPTAAWGGK